jgi:hypothetical protein
MPDRRATNTAWLVFAVVYKKFLAEVSGLAIGIQEVAQSGATFGDRIAQHIANRLRKFGKARL